MIGGVCCPMVVVYFKAEQSVCLNKTTITIEDVAKIYCNDKDIEFGIKKTKLMKFKKGENGKAVLSILKIIELVENQYTDVFFENIGEIDLIVYYKPPNQKESKILLSLKIAAICLVGFFGSAYSIMTYNNDVSANEVFAMLHELFTGKAITGPSIMQLTYCIGLTLGVIVFFNHAANKRLSDDPTPFEVQMRLYEKDVNDTFIIGSDRKEETIDVD